MKRYAINRLQEWKEDPYRLPMIIRGARQVGKTWLMQEFGRTAFEQCAYINFDRNERMQNLFSGDFDVDRILRGLAIESGVEIDPENTLIILDEIQEVPAALQSLKYFCEDSRHRYYILAAGSLLGIAMHEGTSFPVGKVDSMELYPLSFTEFLSATGNEQLLGHRLPVQVYRLAQNVLLCGWDAGGGERLPAQAEPDCRAPGAEAPDLRL